LNNDESDVIVAPWPEATPNGVQHTYRLRQLDRGQADGLLHLLRRRHARLGEAELKEDVVRATPDRIERVRIRRPRGDELRNLRGDRHCATCGRCGGNARQARHPRAALGVVGAALVGGRYREAIVRSEDLRPDRTRIRREEAGAGRQPGLVRPRVGQAVTEEIDVGEPRRCLARRAC
jgi:hypothetical protein